MSETRATVAPDIPHAPRDGAQGLFNQRIKELLDVGLGRHEPLDQFVRFRDLKDGGIANVTIRGKATGSGPGGTGGGRGGGGPFLDPPVIGSRPLPNGHLNVRTQSVWDGIMILWDWPPGAIEYAYTEVWCAAPAAATPSVSPPLSQATLVGTSSGNLFVHSGLGLQQTRYYWLRYVGFSINGAEPEKSVFTPGEGAPGVRGDTSLDPHYVLGVLAGQITESQLYGVLNQRIDLVDFYYNAQGVKVPVEAVPIFDSSGNLIPGTSVKNIQNRIVAAVKDSSGFTVAIQEFRQIVINQLGLFAAAGLKIDAGGYIAGWGLSVESIIDPETGLPFPYVDPATGLYKPGTLSSNFIIRADKFAIVRPELDEAGLPIIPFIVGLVNGEETVGINGQLVVDGSITANRIDADSIHASDVFTQKLWAALVTADRVFSNSLATRGDLSWRVEINGEGSDKSNFPFWYGIGETGGSGSVFYLDRQGNVKLAGSLYVSGTGFFRAGADMRVEIGGGDGYLIWAGSGAKNNANGKFYFRDDGTLFIGGNPVAFPVAQGDAHGVDPSVDLTVIAVDGFPTVPVLVQAQVVLGIGQNGIEKTIYQQILVNGAVVDELHVSTTAYTFAVQHLAVVNLPPGTHQIKFHAFCNDVQGGGTVPPQTIFDGRILALQTKASRS